ncbi:type II toxin-antitoxin system prevent-host-death family antitoxin [Patescibacteria group bacterium]|nr:type II toxin-antitoxin system prevent-host-death family antitoxin [Patescibacteria group bacterium]
MKTTTITSTELKRDTAEVLNKVAYGDVVAIVERYGEPLVEIHPVKSARKTKKLSLKEAIDKTFGSIPDFPDVTKDRVSRKRDISW